MALKKAYAGFALPCFMATLWQLAWGQARTLNNARVVLATSSKTHSPFFLIYFCFYYFSYICNIFRYVMLLQRIIRDFPVSGLPQVSIQFKRTLGKFSTFDIWHFGATSRNILKVATIRTHHKSCTTFSPPSSLCSCAQAPSISFSSYNENDKVRASLVT